MLRLVNIQSEPLGVSKQIGFCERRAISLDENGAAIYGQNDNPDTAYRITSKAYLTIESSKIFSGSFIISFIKFELIFEHLKL